MLSIPVLFYSPSVQDWFKYSAPPFPGSEWIAPVVSILIFAYGGTPFLRLAVPELRIRRPGMMTLITLAISVDGILFPDVLIACVGGALQPDTCSPGTPTAETCNGLDDDCDGAIDNGTDMPTACGSGARGATPVLASGGRARPAAPSPTATPPCSGPSSCSTRGCVRRGEPPLSRGSVRATRHGPSPSVDCPKPASPASVGKPTGDSRQPRTGSR